MFQMFGPLISPHIRKDKYSGRKYYVEYEDDDELLHQEDEEEEHQELTDVTLLK